MNYRITVYPFAQKNVSVFKLPAFLVLFLLCSQISSIAQSFVHPGLLHTQEDLNRMKTKVAEGAQPWKSGWDILIANSHSSLTRPVSKVPGIIYRGFDGTHTENYALLFRDAASAYATALRWQISGDAAYADKSIQILNAWAGGLTTISGTSDRYLLAGIQGYQLANAAEIMRTYSGWAPADFAKFQNWMLTVFYSMNHDFLQNHNGSCISHYWANWDLCNMASMLSIGVLCDRRDIYNSAIDYFKNGAGNGAIQKLVPYTQDNLGQWQESGRDQGHTVLGVALAGVFAEMAWHQGDDIYGYDNNRLMKAFEYIAKYNLGYDVPYTTYSNCDGIVQTVISENGRGNVRPVWELVYNHYVKRKGLSAPYISLFAQRVRPEGGGANYGPNSGGYDQLGYGTLTATLEGPVRLNNQSITFPPISGKDFGSVDFAPGALASSGLPVTYSVLDPTVASVNADGTIHVLKPGTTIIYAQQLGNDLYNEAPTVQQSLTVNKIPGTNDGAWNNTSGITTSALSSTSGSSDLKWPLQTFVAGDHIKLTGTVPGGFSASTVYTVAAVNADGSFKLSLQPGGLIIQATTTITNGTASRFQKWQTASNWSSSVVPGGLNATADFGSSSFSNIPGVTLNDNIKIGTLRYASNGTSELVLGNGVNNGMLTFENISGTPHIIMYNTGTRKLFLGYAVNNTRVPLKIAGTQGLTVNTPVYGGGNPAALRIQAAMDWSNFDGALSLEQGTIELHNTLNNSSASDNVLLPPKRLVMGTQNTAVIYFAGSGFASKQTIGALDGTDASFIFSKTNITNGIPTLVIGVDNEDGDYEGTIGMGPVADPAGAGDKGRINIEKIGTGTQVIAGTIKNGTTGGNFSAVSLRQGKLILDGDNEYRGPTTVTGGLLEINGTGLSPVSVIEGKLSGRGSSSADIIIGTGSGSGALIAPGNSIGNFTTTGALTLNSDATYELEYMSSSGKFDKVVANGVTISNATLNLVRLDNAISQELGSGFIIIDNTSDQPISGNFKDLPEGSIIDNGVNLYRITYQGGTGNDVVLTVIRFNQAITFDPLSRKGIISPDFDPGAVASSGLPVSYSSSNSSVATIVDGKIHLTGLGTTLITSSQTGNYKYNAAIPVTQTLFVFDNVAPTVPQALTAAKNVDGKVKLLWQPSTDNVGVTGYFVFLNGIQLNSSTVAETSFVTDAPSGNFINVYAVIATDAEGNLSGESDPEYFTNSNGNGSIPEGMEILKIFPNPSEGNFKVRMNSKETGTVKITVFNSNGVNVYQTEDSKNSVAYQKEIKLKGQAAGTYYVQVAVGIFNTTKTIIIQ